MKRCELVMIACLCTACGNGSSTSASPTAPGGQGLNLTGTFSSSSVVDTSGLHTMKWEITQTGSQINGKVTIQGRLDTGVGTVSGTLTAPLSRSP